MILPKPSRKTRLQKEQEQREKDILARGEMRHDCLMRAKYLCETCGVSLASAGFEWHHVCSGTGKRRQQEAKSTTVCLCPSCHAAVHENRLPVFKRLQAWAKKHNYAAAQTEIERRMAKFTEAA